MNETRLLDLCDELAAAIRRADYDLASELANEVNVLVNDITRKPVFEQEERDTKKSYLRKSNGNLS